MPTKIVCLFLKILDMPILGGGAPTILLYQAYIMKLKSLFERQK